MASHHKTWIPAVIFVIICQILRALAQDDSLSALVDSEALLRCSIAPECGAVHSVKWYRSGQRIALLAEAANLAKPEGPMADRIQVSLTVPSELRIHPVRLEDEDTYTCELTYILPTEKCEPVTIIQLITLMKPSSLVILDQAGNQVKQDSALGGLLENRQVAVECKATGGKPTPSLTWTIGDDEIPGDISTSGEGSETMTTNRLMLDVKREFQGKRLKCSALSDALPHPMYVDLQLDLILLVTDIEISGVSHHVVQGTKVSLECRATGARPPAVISWINATEAVPADHVLTTTELQSDGSYTTLSVLSFWATRWENARTFTCEARQLAAPVEVEDSMRNASQLLDVHYPPVVNYEQDSITVNETIDILLFCKYQANPSTLVSVTWLQNGVELDIKGEPDHYNGGKLEHQELLMKNSSERDIGNYVCRLENAVGVSSTQQSIHVDVHYVPEVQLMSDLDEYSIESSEQNVTLECGVLKGNPTSLTAVRWFLDGELLKQLPHCNDSSLEDTSEDMCSDVEPTRLLLQEVDRSFHGNYSCQGRNSAGWGPRSNDTEIIVYYEPGPAILVYYPQNVVKGKTVKLTCSVEDPGRPKATNYQWHRGSQLIAGVTSSEWIIDPVSLNTETNFTCRAVNEAGFGEPAEIYVEVSAPPSFITTMTPTTGVLFNSSEISLSCRVECSPLCGVGWLKNGKAVDATVVNRDLYTVINTPMSPESRTNHFESTHSQLIFNISNWPGQSLDRLMDNANYSCVSQDNPIGPSIMSNTSLIVEFPPENMTVSNKVVSVTEGNAPEKVICSAKAKPDPTYAWVRYNTSKAATEPEKTKDGVTEKATVNSVREVLSNGYVLDLKRDIWRTESGDLVCEATNKHGTVSITTYLNVKYKPECVITVTETDNEKVLICTANANPNEVHFYWWLKDDNATLDTEAISDHDSQSTLKLGLLTTVDLDSPKTFVCAAKNEVGMSNECSLHVHGYLPWWKWWSRTALIVAVGICILLILVILLCLIIMCICRRRRQASKYNSSVPLEEGSCISPQNESSIVQAIVSQGIPGISPRICLPTTPVQYSEKTRLVPLQQGQSILSDASGRLQADLSQLEASYQAGLQARQNARSNLSLNKDLSVSFCKEGKKVDVVRATIEPSPKKDDAEDDTANNNDASTNDNEIAKAKSKTVTPTTTGNKWPLKPGVLVHVNSNHSLSPKRLKRPDRVAQQTTEDFSKIGILERETNVDAERPDGVINTRIEFDKERCGSLMKRDRRKPSRLARIFLKMRLSRNLKSDEDECLSDSDSVKRTKRTKSNKRALSLVGFSVKEDGDSKERTGQKKRLIRSFFQGHPPVVVPTEGVVTFRRLPKTTEDISNNNLKQVSAKVNASSPKSESADAFNQSLNSSNSRKRKKPGEGPANGVGEEGTGIDNPGVYENLPFHGLQQVPNKPFRPNINDQLIYADAELKDYGPINYKQASIYSRMKQIKEQQKMEFSRKDD